VLDGGLLFVGHPWHLRNRNGRTVDVGSVHLDGVVVLRVLVHVAVDTNGGRVTEADTTVLARGTTQGCATASNTVRRVGTAEGTTVRNDRTGATTNWEGGRRVDIVVLEIDGVVILVVLVNTSGNIDSDRSGESLATVIARGATYGSTALQGLPVTLERSRIDVRVLDIDRVIILAVLVHTVVNRRSDRVAEADSIIIARRTTFSSPARNEGTLESIGCLIVTTTGTTQGGTTELRLPALLERSSGNMVRVSVRVGSLAETNRGTSKAGRRARWNEVWRWVGVGVLHLDGVVVLGVLVHGSLDIGDHWHIKGLTLVIAGRATNRGASVVRVLALGEGTLARSEDRAKFWVNISLLDVDRVVVLGVLIHIGVGLHVGAKGTSETAILIIAGGPANGSAADVRVVAASLDALAVWLWSLSVILRLPGFAVLKLTVPCSIACAAAASRAIGIPPTKPFMVMKCIRFEDYWARTGAAVCS
jgi:hypothetical protein